MRINNNLMAMNTHRQLGLNNAAGAKSIEKLSSGLKINRAGDDAAGLAISEKMRSQIRGLNMASKNSQDGISLIQTAEGALNETHAILQRMRELAVQSSNDTNVTIDRGEIQKEMNQLSSEVNRIANTTEFNTMKLLNGDRAIDSSKSTTTNQYTNINSGTITVTDLTANTIVTNTTQTAGGKFSDYLLNKSVTVAAGSFVDGITSTGGATLPGEGQITIAKGTAGLTVTLNAAGTATETFSTVDTVVANASGDYVYNQHGVSFTISAADYAKITAGSSIDVTGVSAAQTVGFADDFSANTITATITNFSVTNSNTATDLKNVRSITVVQVGSTLDINFLDSAGATIHNDQYADMSTVGTLNYDAHGIKFDYTITAADVTASTSVSATISLSTLVNTVTSSTETTTITSDKSMKFQVGANQAQQMSLDISDMRSKALKATSSAAGTQTLTIGTASVTAYYVSSQNVTDGTSATNSEFSLDVSDASKAGAAITVINAAIENVSGERSKLGAVQNRLEHTIKNLDTSAENLQAAESRIRDVDMAKEMMNLTKNNILQQAAQAMLAQANQAPQGVLQLLR